jgi:hypothetical protein
MRYAWAMPDNAKCMGDTSHKCLTMRYAWAMPNNAKSMGDEDDPYA